MCCGGVLSPEARGILDRQGLSLPRGVLAAPQSSSVRVIDMDSGSARRLGWRSVNVDRGRFDRWLVSLVPARVETAFGCVLRSCRRAGAGIEVVFTGPGGRRRQAAAALVVAADGPGSLVRRQLFPDRPGPLPYPAIQEWFRPRRPLPGFSVWLDRRTTDFCGWVIPKDDEVIVGAAMPPGPRARGMFERFKRRLGKEGLSLGRPVARRGRMLARPRRLRDIFLGDAGAALAGEAAGLVSPGFGEGISFALTTGALLADSLRAGPASFLERYLKACQPLIDGLGLRPES